MRTCLVCLLLVVALLSGGCAITHDYKSALGIKEATTINIIENSDTQDCFLDAMKSWLDTNGYKYNVLPQNGDKNHGWVLTYTGHWNWDWALFLAKATINAYKDGVQAGYAAYSVDGEIVNQNLTKWRSADGTIKKMMSNLFNQIKDTK